MTETTARADVEIRAPRADVWRALTDPEQIKRYFMGNAEVDTDWKVGSPITFRGAWNGREFEDKGAVLTFDPERALAYSHFSPMTGQPDEPESYHRIDITLAGTDEATTVTLEQSNLTGGVTDDDRAHRAQFEQHWQEMLDALRETVEA